MDSDFEWFDLKQQDQTMAEMQSAAFRDFHTGANSKDRHGASRAFAALALSRSMMMNSLAKHRRYENSKQVNETGSEAA